MDAPCDHPSRDRPRVGRIGLVVGRVDDDFATVPEPAVRVQPPDRKPDAAQLVKAVGRLLAALRPLDRDHERSGRGRARTHDCKRQADRQPD